MTKKINKQEFIIILSEKLNISSNKAQIISDIFENNFFLARKNQNKIIFELKETLDINDKEALLIYNTALETIETTIENKLKHPFKNQD